MKTIWIVTIAAMVTVCSVSHAETVKVGFEPFPPLIIDNRSGLTVELLREIEKISDFKFDIQIMPYSRAKISLETGRISLMGHLPHGLETQEFYRYAADLDWKVKSVTDLYGTSIEKIELNHFRELFRIGTPLGNKAFFSEVFDIPLEKFNEGKLENLLMLKLNRIDVFIFERASTMSTLKKLKIKEIVYNTLDDNAPASLAVRRDIPGMRLREKLDRLMRNVDQKRIFGEYLEYMNLPKKSEVLIDE